MIQNGYNSNIYNFCQRIICTVVFFLKVYPQLNPQTVMFCSILWSAVQVDVTKDQNSAGKTVNK